MAIVTRTDEQIQQDILSELKWDARVQPHELGVSVRHGVVTLSGPVESYAKRLAAEEVALRVKGVKAVANDLEVHLPGWGERTDSELAEAAVRGLAWHPLVPATQIEVLVSKGWISLKGEVEWPYQRTEAARAIRSLAGVRGVSNLITLKHKATPAELKEAIEDALVRSAETDADHIRVEVHQGKVTLKGSVRSWAEKKDAERAAWAGAGVTSVENEITVYAR